MKKISESSRLDERRSASSKQKLPSPEDLSTRCPLSFEWGEQGSKSCHPLSNFGQKIWKSEETVVHV